MSPKNIIDVKKFEVKTPDITIKVSPDRPDLIRTQIIDGQKYILIKADENVEVNGVNISIHEYKVATSKKKRYVAKFKYSGAGYYLAGVMPQKDFYDILV